MIVQPKNIIDFIANKKGKKIIRLNFIPAYIGFFLIFIICFFVFILIVAFISLCTKKSDSGNLHSILFSLVTTLFIYLYMRYFFKQKKILFKGELSDNEIEIYNNSPGAYRYTDATLYKQSQILFHWRNVKEVTAYIAGSAYADTDCILVKAEGHNDFIITDKEEGYLVFFKTIYARLKEENGEFYKMEDSTKYIFFFYWQRAKDNS